MSRWGREEEKEFEWLSINDNKNSPSREGRMGIEREMDRVRE